MPWVRPVDPPTLREMVVQLFRSAVPEEASLEITNQVNTSEPPNMNINTSMTRVINCPLVERSVGLLRDIDQERPRIPHHSRVESLSSSGGGSSSLLILLEGGFGSGG